MFVQNAQENNNEPFKNINNGSHFIDQSNRKQTISQSVDRTNFENPIFKLNERFFERTFHLTIVFLLNKRFWRNRKQFFVQYEQDKQKGNDG